MTADHGLPRKGTPIEPTRIPRAQHCISRGDISPGTLKVLYTLKDAGYEAYMVGGGVRDLLAGIRPKDFDVATNARPEEIRRLFRSCRLVGRRFVLAHVRFGHEIVEVSTFRGPIGDAHERDETGRILSDNFYGRTLEEDALRRDFTINGLYYDIRDYSIVDYVGGVEDMKRGLVRLIGDPELRLREDPVRMLRAVRIANKLGFAIAPETAEPIPRLAPLLREIPPARLFEEVLKLFLSRDATANFDGLRQHRLFTELFPLTDAALLEDNPATEVFLREALKSTAERLTQDASVSPAFLFAAMLWPAVALRAASLQAHQGHTATLAYLQAGAEVMAQQTLRVALPKRFGIPAREIWSLQPRFELRGGSRPKRLMAHPRFRAAYDFLLLRAHAGEAVRELADWWTAFQRGEAPQMVEEQAPARRKRRRRGGRGRRRQDPAQGE